MSFSFETHDIEESDGPGHLRTAIELMIPIRLHSAGRVQTRVTAVRLDAGHPITALVADYLRGLATQPGQSDADLLEPPGDDPVRELLLTHLRGDRQSAEPADASLPMRILDYARDHLHDPGLSAEQIAAAQYISVRYLYKVLSAEGIGLAEWLRTRRLEACRQALATEAGSATVAAIARRCGFSNMSSFSRSFRAEYGMTPRQWRDQHSRNGSEAVDADVRGRP